MRAARLRQIITFQKKVKSKSSLGQSTHTWEDITTSPAEIIPYSAASGSYKYKNDHHLDESKYQITLRWRPDLKISKAQRIVHQDDIHEITGVENVQNRNREYRIVTRIIE